MGRGCRGSDGRAEPTFELLTGHPYTGSGRSAAKSAMIKTAFTGSATRPSVSCSSSTGSPTARAGMARRQNRGAPRRGGDVRRRRSVVPPTRYGHAPNGAAGGASCRHRIAPPPGRSARPQGEPPVWRRALAPASPLGSPVRAASPKAPSNPVQAGSPSVASHLTRQERGHPGGVQADQQSQVQGDHARQPRTRRQPGKGVGHAVHAVVEAQGRPSEQRPTGLLEDVGDDRGVGASRSARTAWLRVASCWVQSPEGRSATPGRHTPGR